MGLFSKRKPATAASQASLPDELEKAASTSTSSEYVFAPSSPPSRANGHNMYAHPDTPVSSASILKIPFRRKRRQQQPASPSAAGDSNPSSFSLSVAGSPATSKASTTSAISELDIPLPPRKSFVFSRSRDDVNSASTHSLPNPSSSHLSSAPLRVPSEDNAKDTDGSSGFFTWAIRERTRSKPSRPPPIPVSPIPPPLPNTSSRLQVPEMDLTPTSSDTPSSFNLKSFRHVRPDTSPPPASASSSRLNLTLKPGSPITRPASSVSVATSDPASPSLLPPARPRPRGDSVASDSSQRISVAAFREAQARRSQAGSPAPSMRPSAFPPTAGVRRPSMPIRRLSGSSSTSSESSSGESSSDHGDRKEATMARNSTITAKTSSTGLTRRLSKSKSTAQIANGRSGMSLDTYSATQSSRSTSALTIDSAAHDEASKNIEIGGKTNLDLVDDGDSEDDAPLASLVQPRKSPAVPSPDIKPKPLIDINSLLQGSNSTGRIEDSQRSDAKDEEKKVDEEEDEETLRGKPCQPQFMHRRSSSDHGLNSSISTNMPTSTSFMYDDAYDDGPAPSSGIRLVAQPKLQAQTKDMATSSSRSELGHGPAPGVNGRREPVAAIGPSYIRSGAKSELGHGTTDSQSTITLATSITPIPIHERKPPSGFSVTSRPMRVQQPQKSHTLQVETTETRIPSSSSKQRERASTIAAPAPSLEARLRAVMADASSSPSRLKARDASDNGISSSASSSVAAGGTRASTGVHGRGSSTSSSSSSPSHSGIRKMSASYTTPLKPPAQAHGGSPSSSSLKKPLIDLTVPTQVADYSPLSSAPSMHARTRSSSSASEAASTSRKITNAPLARPNTLVSLIPPSSTSSMSGTTTKPWVRREDSPASSTGGSSSSRMPLTPRDGSEVGYGKRNSAWNGSEVGGGHTSAIITRGAKSKSKAREDTKSEGGTDAGMRGEESKRRERRRSEAMRAIELGNVINGRVSLDKDSDDEVLGRPITGGGVGSPLELDPRMTMMNPMMGMNMNMPMNNMGSSPFGPPGSWAGMTPSPSSSQLMTDPNFLVAHQQAMMIAKQAYQYAVAQQAMAAAADEWERGSAISGFTAAGGGGGGGGGGAPVSGYFGQMTGFGGGMGWPGMPVMFPSSARSVYAGSAASDIGGGGGWGARSAYGETFGPADRSSRSSAFLQQQQLGGAGVRPPQGQRSESAGNAGGGSGAMARSGMGPRPRTTTAPSNTPLPPQHARANRAAPPSSWKAT